MGRAIALELASAGCDIVVHFNSSRADADATVEEIRKRGRKAALVEKIEFYAYVAWQAALSAAEHKRHDEQMILVDKPAADRVRGEGRTTYGNIAR